IRGAFYLLLLIAVCVIPFALAQRNAAKQNVAKPIARPNLALSGTDLSLRPTDVARGQASRVRASAATDALRSQFPTRTGARAGKSFTPMQMPKAPQVVLYDQYDNAGFNATFSGTLSDFVGFDADLADDFVVPAGQTWNVDSIDADGVYFNGFGPANSFNVFISSDSGGFPGTQVY